MVIHLATKGIHRLFLSLKFRFFFLNPISFRILGSELSRAEAESLMASDYEDLSDIEKDDHVDNSRKGDAVSFMGQLTPGSSVSKARSRTPDCQTWTRYVPAISNLTYVRVN